MIEASHALQGHQGMASEQWLARDTPVPRSGWPDG